MSSRKPALKMPFHSRNEAKKWQQKDYPTQCSGCLYLCIFHAVARFERHTLNAFEDLWREIFFRLKCQNKIHFFRARHDESRWIDASKRCRRWCGDCGGGCDDFEMYIICTSIHFGMVATGGRCQPIAGDWLDNGKTINISLNDYRFVRRAYNAAQWQCHQSKLSPRKCPANVNTIIFNNLKMTIMAITLNMNKNNNNSHCGVCVACKRSAKNERRLKIRRRHRLLYSVANVEFDQTKTMAFSSGNEAVESHLESMIKRRYRDLPVLAFGTIEPVRMG